MNLEPIIQSEVSLKEKNKYHVLTHMYGMQEDYWYTYLQGCHGDAVIEYRLVDTVGEGEDGKNWQSNMETYKLPYVK